MIATGVDKEEEVEVHLQTAITAAQVGAQRVVIPTPISNVLVDDYEQLFGRVTDRNVLPCPSNTREYVKITNSMLDEGMRRIGRYNAVSEGDLSMLNQDGSATIHL